MIHPKILRQREGRYDPKDLEGVLPVLDRRLYDGGDGGVVPCAGLRAEASADLELGLGGAEGLFAVVVRGRDSWAVPFISVFSMNVGRMASWASCAPFVLVWN